MKEAVRKKIFIVGAGVSGQGIARELAEKKIFGTVGAFIDNDPDLIGKKIDGIPVFGPLDMAHLLQHGSEDEALIAIPGASNEKIRHIYGKLLEAGFSKISILPRISQIVDGDVHLIQTRAIDPLDILGRTAITIPLKESLSYLRKKRVLITGAGGTVGAEISRQLLSGGIDRLYLFGHGENSIYEINRQLHVLQSEGVGEKTSIVPIIGDITDRDYLHWLLPQMNVDVIFHCAAHKHVPLMEENPVAAIKNNVFGTVNLVDASLAAGIKRFVLISTDKAVEPVSVYGVSKMICEKIVMNASKRTKNADYMFVRFGNVFGSRGSVFPLFMDQIRTGGPVTVTDPRMQRYFMTIAEACSLVLKTGGIGKNGYSYLLDMGEPLRVVDIAEQLIRFSGYEVGKDIKIEFIGSRQGERLDEPLWTAQENPQRTEHEKILQLQSAPTNFDLDGIISQLHPICFLDKNRPEAYRNKDLLFKVLSPVLYKSED